MGGEPVTRLMRDYARAYADCYRWLYRVCPPWRWLLSAGCMPGSPLWRAAADLRREALS
jgi:hypothetical protein